MTARIRRLLPDRREADQCASMPSSQWTGPCPASPGETARAYLQKSLSRDAADAFEDHFIGCPLCSAPLQFKPEFVQAVNRAAARLGHGPCTRSGL